MTRLKYQQTLEKHCLFPKNSQTIWLQFGILFTIIMLSSWPKSTHI